MHRSNGRGSLAWSLVALAALFVANAARAGGAEYLLPLNGDNVMGVVTTAVAEHEDTLLDIGRRYGVGYEEIIAANPGIDPWLPGAGTEVLLPTRFVLPDAPREGIVVNLPEHRLYYFPPAKAGEPRVVRTYPDQHRQDGLEDAARRHQGGLEAGASELESAGVRAARAHREGRSAAEGRAAGPGQSARRICDAARHPERLPT